MEFRLLGPFQASHDGRPVDVGSRRQQRCLLAVLLLHADRIVSIDRLGDLLWDAHPPESARRVIHTYVGRLRGNLERYGVRISTRRDGYLLHGETHVVDVTEFRRLAGLATHALDAAERVRLLDSALALWRGPLLADLADDRLRDRLDADLAELLLTSRELHAEALLATGGHDRVVTDLTPLVSRHPTRERLVGHLMTGLYRCGRRADALEAYRSARAALVEELGLEPGTELRTLHQRILRDDPELGVRPLPVYAVRVRGHVLPWSVGGHPALEFCNTLAGWPRNAHTPHDEWLRSYATFAVWTGYADLAADETVTGLLEASAEAPEEAAAVLEEARELRADVYSCLTDPGDAAAFARMAKVAEAAARFSVFKRDPDGLGRWTLRPDAGLRLPLYAVARVAADLLADPRRYTVRACHSAECGWLFLDHTGLRKWCSTQTCANAEPSTTVRR